MDYEESEMKTLNRDKVLAVFDDNIQYCDGNRERAFVTNLRETIAELDDEGAKEAQLGQFTGGMEVDIFMRQSGSQRKPVKIATLAGVAGNLIFRPEVKP